MRTLREDGPARFRPRPAAGRIPGAAALLVYMPAALAVAFVVWVEMVVLSILGPLVLFLVEVAVAGATMLLGALAAYLLGQAFVVRRRPP